ncbi:hypothetical protein SALBM311S_11040 [Streptomyces alboniger]
MPSWAVRRGWRGWCCQGRRSTETFRLRSAPILRGAKRPPSRPRTRTPRPRTWSCRWWRRARWARWPGTGTYGGPDEPVPVRPPAAAVTTAALIAHPPAHRSPTWTSSPGPCSPRPTTGSAPAARNSASPKPGSGPRPSPPSRGPCGTRRPNCPPPSGFGSGTTTASGRTRPHGGTYSRGSWAAARRPGGGWTRRRRGSTDSARWKGSSEKPWRSRRPGSGSSRRAPGPPRPPSGTSPSGTRPPRPPRSRGTSNRPRTDWCSPPPASTRPARRPTGPIPGARSTICVPPRAPWPRPPSSSPPSTGSPTS